MNARREKQPRDYAREIAELPTRQARAEALARVPPHWQALVRETVDSAFAVRRGRGPAVAAGVAISGGIDNTV
jgi:hypothetical protein